MRFRARRLYRYLLVGAILAAGLVVASDIILLQLFESRAGTGVARSTAAERASVDLGGSPFLPGYFRERLDEVEVEVLGMSGSGLRVDRFELVMTDVRFDRTRARRLVRSRYATRMQVTGSDIIGRFEISQRDLSGYLRSRIPGIEELVITTSGVEVMFEVEDDTEGSRPVRYLPTLLRDEEERLGLGLQLVGESDVPQGRLDDARRLADLIELPRLPVGVQGNVELGNGVFAVEFAGPEASIWVGAGSAEQ